MRAIFASVIWILFFCVTFVGISHGEEGKALFDELTSDAFVKADEQIKDISSATNGNQSNSSVILETDRRKQEFYLRKEKYRFGITLVLCIAPFIFLVWYLYFRYKCTKDISSVDVNIIALVLLIFGPIILVLVSDTEQQITAAIGIFGAIAGYLFGTMKKTADDHKQSPPSSPPGDKNPVGT